jgi:putative methionine-R-sulfoxide reductase with GAF domain
MLNKPKYILFILSIAFSALTLANVVLFYFHIEEQTTFVLATVATCSFSTFSMLYLFFHFKKNYISKKVVQDQDGNLDMNKIKAELEKEQAGLILDAKKKKFEEFLQTNKSNAGFAQVLVSKLATELEACQVAYFLAESRNGKKMLKLTASFAYHVPESQEVVFEFGEGLSGQVAVEGKLVNIKNVPDGYITVISGLGKATPSNLAIVPFVKNGNVVAVMEIASFKEIDKQDEAYLAFVGENS